jgi:glycosyltransferase EpsE
MLNSLNGQSFHDWEIVVLLDRDDGSNRNAVCQTISSNRIKFVDVDISVEGFAGALNRGVGFCNGKYVARCDDDDLSVPTRFEQQVKILETNPCIAVVTGWAKVVDIHGALIREIQHPTNAMQLMRALCKSNIFPHSATTFRKNTFTKSGGYLQGMDGCEDYELWLRMAVEGDLMSTGTYLISYLDNPEGMSRWKLEKNQLKEIRIAQRRLLKRLSVPMFMRELNVFVSRLRRVGAKLKVQFSL